MQILAELAKSSEGASLVWLSEQLRLPKTSLFSLLRSLEAGHFVVSDNGMHRLGAAAFGLASAILHHDGFAAQLRPTLQWLQHEAGETATLAVPAADWSHLTFADVVESGSPLRYTASVGSERSLYSTSIGLALLAFASPEHQTRYFDTPGWSG